MRALALILVVAGCTSQGTGPVERLAPALRSAVLGGETPAPAPAPTRAQLDAVRSATIAVSFNGGPRAFVTAVADNGGYVTYQDPARRGVVLLGGAVAGSDGFPTDLAAVRHQHDDPVARPVPLAAWPGRVDRSYQFRLRDTADYAITLACTHTPAARERIEIVERQYDTVRVVETCTNARRQVQNTYWVDAATGFIWKSEQWLGPDLPPVTVEILRPYAAR